MQRNIQRTALVTGATGVIGSLLTQRLLEQGWKVRAIVRKNSESVPNAVQIVSGDITNADVVKAGMVGINVVFHLAAKLHINNPSRDLAAEYRNVNVKGTENLLSAARHSGIQRFVFFSTISVYGGTKAGIIADETSPIKLESTYSKTKYEAERSVLECGVPSVVLRLAAVYGRGMKGNYVRLLESLRRNRFVYVGSGTNRRTLVHLSDVCSAAVLAAEHPMAIGKIFNVTDGKIHTLREVVIAICIALGKSPPRISLPIWPVRVGAAALEIVCKLCGKPVFVTAAMIDKVTEDVAVRCDKIQCELGYKPQFDLAGGWYDIAREKVSSGIRESEQCSTGRSSAPR